MRTFVVTIEDSSVAEEPSAIFGNVKGILSIKETKGSKFKNLALPGPPLTDEEMEALAQETEDDIKFNLDSFMTVEQLKSSLDEELKDLFASNKTK